MKFSLIILVFISANTVSAQIKHGNFQYSSKSVNTVLDADFSTLTINKDSAFTYQYRISGGCSIWFDISGKWEAKGDTLILIDSVLTFSGRILSDTNIKKLFIAAHRTENNPSSFIERRTFFIVSTTGSLLNYLTAEYDQKFGMPVRQISGNFTYVK